MQAALSLIYSTCNTIQLSETESPNSRMITIDLKNRLLSRLDLKAFSRITTAKMGKGFLLGVDTEGKLRFIFDKSPETVNHATIDTAAKLAKIGMELIADDGLFLPQKLLSIYRNCMDALFADSNNLDPKGFNFSLLVFFEKNDFDLRVQARVNQEQALHLAEGCHEPLHEAELVFEYYQKQLEASRSSKSLDKNPELCERYINRYREQYEWYERLKKRYSGNAREKVIQEWIDLRILQIDLELSKLSLKPPKISYSKRMSEQTKKIVLSLAKTEANELILKIFLKKNPLFSFQTEILPIFLNRQNTLPVSFLLLLAKNIQEFSADLDNPEIHSDTALVIYNRMLSSGRLTLLQKHEVNQQKIRIQFPVMDSHDKEWSSKEQMLKFFIHYFKKMNLSKETANVIINSLNEIVLELFFGKYAHSKNIRKLTNIACIDLLGKLEKDGIFPLLEPDHFVLLSDIFSNLLQKKKFDNNPEIQKYLKSYQIHYFRALRIYFRDTLGHEGFHDPEIQFLLEVSRIIYLDPQSETDFEIALNELKAALAERYQSLKTLDMLFEEIKLWPTTELSVRIAKLINPARYLQLVIPSLLNNGWKQTHDNVNLLSWKQIIIIDEDKTAILLEDLLQQARCNFERQCAQIFTYQSANTELIPLSRKDLERLDRLMPGVLEIHAFCEVRAQKERLTALGILESFYRALKNSSTSGSGEEYNAHGNIYATIIEFMHWFDNLNSEDKQKIEKMSGAQGFTIRSLITKLSRSPVNGVLGPLNVNHCIKLNAMSLRFFIEKNKNELASIKTTVTDLSESLDCKGEYYYRDYLNKIGIATKTRPYLRSYDSIMMSVDSLRENINAIDFSSPPCALFFKLKQFIVEEAGQLSEHSNVYGFKNKLQSYSNLWLATESVSRLFLARNLEEQVQCLIALHCLLTDIANTVETISGLHMPKFFVLKVERPYNQFFKTNEALYEACGLRFDIDEGMDFEKTTELSLEYCKGVLYNALIPIKEAPYLSSKR